MGRRSSLDDCILFACRKRSQACGQDPGLSPSRLCGQHVQRPRTDAKEPRAVGFCVDQRSGRVLHERRPSHLRYLREQLMVSAHYFDKVNGQRSELLSHARCRYLDQLGLAAKYNTRAYCRQSLIGGNYGLLDLKSFKPNPDYYRLLNLRRFKSGR